MPVSDTSFFSSYLKTLVIFGFKEKCTVQCSLDFVFTNKKEEMWYLKTFFFEMETDRYIHRQKTQHRSFLQCDLGMAQTWLHT